jgi:hypothetical protein
VLKSFLSSLGENECFNIVLRRHTMRVWMMLGVGALLLVAVIVPCGVWGATIEDVRKEMADNPSPYWGTRLLMLVPMEPSGVSGHMLMPMNELCASGGTLRPISDGATGTDMGPVPPGNEYTVQILMRDGGGYDIWKYSRKVTVPGCK